MFCCALLQTSPVESRILAAMLVKVIWWDLILFWYLFWRKTYLRGAYVHYWNYTVAVK